MAVLHENPAIVNQGDDIMINEQGFPVFITTSRIEYNHGELGFARYSSFTMI